MASHKNGRYNEDGSSKDDQIRRLSAIRGMRSKYNEGDLHEDSPITVGSSIACSLVCFFDCRCRKQARMSPADMRRHKFDLNASIWSVASRLYCTRCNRRGNIVRITRVRVSGANPGEL